MSWDSNPACTDTTLSLYRLLHHFLSRAETSEADLKSGSLFKFLQILLRLNFHFSPSFWNDWKKKFSSYPRRQRQQRRQRQCQRRQRLERQRHRRRQRQCQRRQRLHNRRFFIQLAIFTNAKGRVRTGLENPISAFKKVLFVASMCEIPYWPEPGP